MSNNHSDKILNNTLNESFIQESTQLNNYTNYNIASNYNNNNNINNPILTNKSNAEFHNLNFFKLNTLYSDNLNVSSSNQTSQSYVPTTRTIISTAKQITTTTVKENTTKISDQNFTDSNRIQLGTSTNRNGKDSIIRAALRAAARQGLEAMMELYDKQEPNLLSKGQYYNIDLLSSLRLPYA